MDVRRPNLAVLPGNVSPPPDLWFPPPLSEPRPEPAPASMTAATATIPAVRVPATDAGAHATEAGSADGAPASPRKRRRRVDHLLRTGNLLTASSLATSALGAGYWVFVARWYDASEVGRAYSAVSAMTFLAGFGQLNLSNTLVRFVPSAGAETGRLIRRVYLAAVSVTALASVLFVILVPHLSHALAFLHSPVAGLGFTVGATAYALFAIQDGALTGLLRADWVLLENAVFSVAKMGFVVLFAMLAMSEGILVSWYASLAVAIGLTNWLLFTKAVPAQNRSAARRPEPARPTLAYLAGDFTGAMCWLVATTLMPVIVADRLGLAQSAYFSLPWMVAYTLYLFSTNMGSSIVVEAANDFAGLAANCRRVLRHTGPRLLAAVGALVLGAPLILRVFGSGYAAHATGLIRLLLLSALPNLIVDTAVASGRARRRIGVVVVILALDSAAAIGLTFVLLPRVGIAGAGYGWLISQSATALVLLARRSWWLGSRDRSGDGDRGEGNRGGGAGRGSASKARKTAPARRHRGAHVRPMVAHRTPAVRLESTGRGPSGLAPYQCTTDKMDESVRYLCSRIRLRRDPLDPIEASAR